MVDHIYTKNISNQTKCSLCESFGVVVLYISEGKGLNRTYLHCKYCDLVFVPSDFHLNLVEQKTRYLEHNNDIDDPDYRKFLFRLWKYVKPSLSKGAKGLDYGTGPGPALVQMVIEDGYDIVPYDPIFYPYKYLLERTYDFITCTETLEHFANPNIEITKIKKLLKPNGILGIMTSMLASWSDFPNWYYHRDPTHIAFYSKDTMEWIAEKFSWNIEFPRENVVLFKL